MILEMIIGSTHNSIVSSSSFNLKINGSSSFKLNNSGFNGFKIAYPKAIITALIITIAKTDNAKFVNLAFTFSSS